MNQPPGHRVVVSAWGDSPTDALEHHIELREQASPPVDELQPTDVVIAVRSAAVGWVDLLMTSGLYQHMASPPYTPGLEYAGEVAWIGANVEGWSVGDRVIADGFRTGPRSKGAYQKWGGFASYAVAPQEALMPLPDAFDFDQGANFLGNYETAYHCLIARGRLTAEDTVLIHGASGSTGLAAVHLAKIVGATVIATSRSPEKLEVIGEQGADHLVQTGGDDGGVRRFRDEVKELTGGRGVSVVYDGVGGDISLESLRCVAFGARYLVVGWASTPFVAQTKPNVLPTNLIMMKGLDVLGCPTVISTHVDPSIRVERLGQLRAWVDEGRLTPFVSRMFPLSEFREAMLAKWRSNFVGGCVLHPGG